MKITVYYEGRVIDASHELVINDGEAMVWAVPFDKVQRGFYIDHQECSEQQRGETGYSSEQQKEEYYERQQQDNYHYEQQQEEYYRQ